MARITLPLSADIIGLDQSRAAIEALEAAASLGGLDSEPLIEVEDGPALVPSFAGEPLCLIEIGEAQSGDDGITIPVRMTPGPGFAALVAEIVKRSAVPLHLEWVDGWPMLSARVMDDACTPLAERDHVR